MDATTATLATWWNGLAFGGDHFLLAGLAVACLALAAEYVDSTLGMGYGTTLTPLLMLLGFAPMQVVPAVLLSELLTGLTAAAAHHRAGNVDFRIRTRDADGRPIAKMLLDLGYLATAKRALPRPLRIAMLLGACSMAGAIAATLLAVKLSKVYLNLYIGVMVTVIGAFILVRRRSEGRFSWTKITGLGLVASFNKGLSGGGYGPLVCGGQVLAGVDGRSAVAITSLAEGLTCAVGFTALLLAGQVRDWCLMPYLCAGALLSVPLSAHTVKRINLRHLKVIIAAATLILGLLTLWKIRSEIATMLGVA